MERLFTLCFRKVTPILLLVVNGDENALVLVTDRDAIIHSKVVTPVMVKKRAMVLFYESMYMER